MVALAATGWGLWPLFLRHAEGGGQAGQAGQAGSAIPPSLEAAVAMALLTGMAGALVLRDRLSVRATRSDWIKIGFLGVADALNVILFFAAYQRTSVAIAVLTHYLTPVLVALAAPVFLGEPWRRRTFLAVLVSFGGLVLLLAPGLASSLASEHGGPAAGHAADLVGAALGAASAVFYASNVIVSKKLVPVFSGSEMAFYHGLLAVPLLVALVPQHAWHGVWQSAWHDAPGRGLAWLLAGSVLSGALSGLLFVWGLRRVCASHASHLTLIEPLVATLVAGFAFGERLGAGTLAGGVLILIGAALAVTGR